MSNILIIGATSAIAVATARNYAQSNNDLFLVARNKEKLTTITNDLKIRGAKSVECALVDICNHKEHQSVIDKVFSTMGNVDIVLIAHGTLPDQKMCESNFEITLSEINTNAISTISLLTHIANKLEVQKNGTIAVITSVAGDRGRQSNYIYGSAKGMISIFLQGLRNRLYRSGVNVLDIKPGFVDTPMTRDFKKGLLWAQPETVAAYIERSITKNRHVVYAPFFWRYIMIVIRLIPEPIFKRMKL